MSVETYEPRFRTKFVSEIRPRLAGELQMNPMAVPTLEKIVVNMGLGEVLREPKALDEAIEELATITGQRPVVTRAKKSIAAFKLRAGVSIGAKVTLRGARMWEFFDRLLTLAIPRIRDFRGFSPRQFDGRGDYTLGITDQTVFPEIQYDKVTKVRGMDITIVTTAKDDDGGKAFLTAFGFPFRSN